MMKVSPGERVVIIPLLPSADMRWQARQQRDRCAGRLLRHRAGAVRRKAAICHTQRRPTAAYLNALYQGETHAKPPSAAQLRADLGYWRLTALVAVTSRDSALGKYLTRTLGPPTTARGSVLAWRHYGPGWLTLR